MIETLLALTLSSGLYHCKVDENICDQQVGVYKTGELVTAIKVEYVGWCGSMGPYLYPCSADGVCGDMNARFTIREDQSYLWQNLGYPYQCDFTLKPSVELSE